MTRGYPDYEGGKSKLYTVDEWAAFEGIDKNLFLTAVNKASGILTTGTYIVPSGKTLYVSGLGFSLVASEADDRDNNQIGYALLSGTLLVTKYSVVGGNGGGMAIFDKPIVIASGYTLNYSLANYANHNCDGYLSVWGYEL